MKLDKKTLWTLFAFACGVILFAWGVNNADVLAGIIGGIGTLLFPLLFGLCVAFVLNIPMRFFEKLFFPHSKKAFVQRLRRPVCMFGSFAAILAFLALLFALVIPELIRAFTVIAAAVPPALTAVQQWAQENADLWPSLQQWLVTLEIDWPSLSQKVFGSITSGMGDFLSNTVGVVVALMGGIFNCVIGLIFAFYVLLDKDRLKRQGAAVLRALFNSVLCEKIFFVLDLTKRTFANYVTGQCTEACILGVLCWLGMLLLGFPYAPMVGALVGFSALIPLVGAFIGASVGAFMIFTIDPLQAVWFLVFLITLQQIEGNLIYPRVVGSSVGLPPLWVLFAVTIGGGLGGIVGMLFAVPVCSVLYALTRLAVRERLARLDTADTPEPPAGA